MARHSDDAQNWNDVAIATGAEIFIFQKAVHTDCTRAELKPLRNAAAAGPAALDAWFAALPVTDDRRAWWAGLPGGDRNVFRAAFLVGRD